MKLSAKALAIVLLFVGLVLVNYLASSLPARLDLTADSIYSLSPGTKAMLGKIEEPVVIDLYFSKDASGLPIQYKNYATRVQEMLRQYVRAGRGKLTLNVITRAPTPPTRKRPRPPVSPPRSPSRAANSSSSASSSPRPTSRKTSPPSPPSANSSSNTISRNSSTASSRSTNPNSASSPVSRSRAPAPRRCK